MPGVYVGHRLIRGDRLDELFNETRHNGESLFFKFQNPLSNSSACRTIKCFRPGILITSGKELKRAAHARIVLIAGCELSGHN